MQRTRRANLSASEPVSRLQVVSEREILPAPQPEAKQEKMQDSPTSKKSEQWSGTLAAMYAAIAQILAVRLMLLLGLVGATVLAVLTVVDPTAAKIVATCVFDLFVFVPTILLYYRRG